MTKSSSTLSSDSVRAILLTLARADEMDRVTDAVTLLDMHGPILKMINFTLGSIHNRIVFLDNVRDYQQMLEKRDAHRKATRPRAAE